MNKNTLHIIAVIFLLTIGFGIRLINLGEPGFGTDEPLHVFAAKGIMETGEPQLPSGLFYYRAELFSKIVAQSFKYLGVSEFSARLPSAVFGTITILVIYLIGKNLFGATVGLLSALFLTFLPIEIAWSRECRMYVLFQLSFLIGAYAFYKGIETTPGVGERVAVSKNKIVSWAQSFFSGFDLKWLLLAALFLYLSLKLQNLTVLFGPSVVVYLIVMSLSVLVQENFKSMRKSKYFKLLIAIFAAGLIFLFIVPGLLEGFIKMMWFKPFWAQAHQFNPFYWVEIIYFCNL